MDTFEGTFTASWLDWRLIEALPVGAGAVSLMVSVGSPWLGTSDVLSVIESSAAAAGGGAGAGGGVGVGAGVGAGVGVGVGVVVLLSHALNDTTLATIRAPNRRPLRTTMHLHCRPLFGGCNSNPKPERMDMLFCMRRAAVVVLLAAMGVSADGNDARTVALTFDDLPGADSRESGELTSTNLAILQALDRHQAPATGFVIGERVMALSNGRDLLNSWIEHGHDLGNHTFTHRDLNDLTLAEFGDDVARGESVFRALLPTPRTLPLFLRFPFNHTGDTVEKRAGAAALLSDRGYEVAVCTIENADYVFANAYQKARRTGGSGGAILRTEYLSHTAKIIDYYVDLHRQIFGRETPHVMLLHVNRLNADVLDAVLELFEQRQFRFATLREAQTDAAYKTADTWTTKAGPMWAYRWARSLGVKVNGALEPEPAAWVSAAAR
jgi:peptidoglycan/xylan/chitin deacetylase (PgdA/CDA1 family)